MKHSQDAEQTVVRLMREFADTEQQMKSNWSFALVKLRGELIDAIFEVCRGTMPSQLRKQLQRASFRGTIDGVAALDDTDQALLH